jgi:anthranilate/para-aminobenzoate synthase component I
VETDHSKNIHAGRNHADHAIFRCAGLSEQHAEFEVEGVWFAVQQDSDPIRSIQHILETHHRDGCGWGMMLSYELGGWVEPLARSSAKDDLGFPLCVMMRLGDEIKRERPRGDFRVGPVRSRTGQSKYMDHVERIREYIAAGDIYQANLAHRLRGEFDGDPIACAEQFIHHANPRHGAFVRFMHEGLSHTICSISPELFVRIDREQSTIQTEPMKGTRPIGADMGELDRNAKDRAELNMITDLMRNDIGRVCELGSVRVRSPRRIEPHGSGVLQASSVIEGTIRANLTIAEIIRAMFPPGSVTGAPKVRAMQVIDEFERSPRRAYCGSVMHIDPDGSINASVAIRTAHIWGEVDTDRPAEIHDGSFEYAVGAGIVADSDPQAEWDETLIKAAVLARALDVELVHHR